MLAVSKIVVSCDSCREENLLTKVTWICTCQNHKNTLIKFWEMLPFTLSRWAFSMYLSYSHCSWSNLPRPADPKSQSCISLKIILQASSELNNFLHLRIFKKRFCYRYVDWFLREKRNLTILCLVYCWRKHFTTNTFLFLYSLNWMASYVTDSVLRNII